MDPAPPPPAEAAPAEAPLPSPDQTSAEDLRLGGVITWAYSTTGQDAAGDQLALGGARYGAPILGFWGLSADATYWPADFDFGAFGIDAHAGGRVEVWNVRDRRDVVLPGDAHAGFVIRPKPGAFSLGYGGGLRLVTLPIVAYTDTTLDEAEPQLAPMLGAYGALVAWWEPTSGFLDGGQARADARVTLGTVLGAHAGVIADKPVDGLPVLLRGGLATDMDLGFRLGNDAARTTRLAITASVGVAQVF